MASVLGNLLLAAGTSSETKGNLERAPTMPEQFEHTISVEDVKTAELYAGFLSQLAGVANRAQFVIVWQPSRLKVTRRIETRQAFFFLPDSIALVPALLNFFAS